MNHRLVLPKLTSGQVTPVKGSQPRLPAVVTQVCNKIRSAVMKSRCVRKAVATELACSKAEGVVQRTLSRAVRTIR